jgi:hypothetical protein
LFTSTVVLGSALLVKRSRSVVPFCSRISDVEVSESASDGGSGLSAAMWLWCGFAAPSPARLPPERKLQLKLPACGMK